MNENHHATPPSQDSGLQRFAQQSDITLSCRYRIAFQLVSQ